MEVQSEEPPTTKDVDNEARMPDIKVNILHNFACSSDINLVTLKPTNQHKRAFFACNICTPRFLKQQMTNIDLARIQNHRMMFSVR
jgi:hypothetical protein